MQLGKNLWLTALASLVSFMTFTNALAEEKIVKQEDITFEKCLKVITTSESKLSIAPSIEKSSDQKRVAIFLLTDGTLTIACDKKAGTVTVSTKTN